MASLSQYFQVRFRFLLQRSSIYAVILLAAGFLFLLISFEESITDYQYLFLDKKALFATKLSLPRKLRLSLRRTGQKIKILYWYNPPTNSNFVNVGDPNECGNCVISFNRSEINEDSTRAIVFDYPKLQHKDLPLHRRTDQYYVWRTMDSPYQTIRKSHAFLDTYDNMFNLTMTYRWDSDVFSPHGHVQKSYYDLKMNPLTTPEERSKFMASKSQLAVWFASDCKSSSIKKKVFNSASMLVRAGLKLDRFGKCFTGYVKDHKKIIEKAKFYMAFEDAEYCKDYITEKFFENALQYGAVPVVIGAKKKDYEALAPPNSFIYAKDYPVKRLVEYLNYLDNNDTAYLEYFKWRQTPPVLKQGFKVQTGFCQLCRILHGINVDNLYNSKYEEKYKHIPLFGFPDQPRIVKSISKWYYGEENRKCFYSFPKSNNLRETF